MKPTWSIRTSHSRRCGHLVLVGLTVSVVLFHLFGTDRYRSRDTHQKSSALVNVKKIDPKNGNVYKFYDYGSVYHDMNFSCPVSWVRVHC